MKMKRRLIVDLVGHFQDQAGIEVIIDADLVLLPPGRHVDRRAEGRQVQLVRVDSREGDVAIPIDQFGVMTDTGTWPATAGRRAGNKSPRGGSDCR